MIETIEGSNHREHGSSWRPLRPVARPVRLSREPSGLSAQPDSSFIESLLWQWTADEIITPGQAVKMRAYVAQERPKSARAGQVVAEALGYLGGAIVVAASVLIAAQVWMDLATSWRLVVLGLAAAVLQAAGWSISKTLTGIGDRVRAVLWLASTGAACGFFGVIAVSVLELQGPDTALLITFGTAAYATALWVWNRSPLQQSAMIVALALTFAAAINALDVSEDLNGLGLWAVGISWALLGWGGLLTPRRLALVLGSVTAIIGAMVTAGSDAGLVLALVTVIAVWRAAVALRDLALLAVGTIGALWSVPVAMTTWFPDSMAATYALLLVGGLLVAVAVRIARRSGEQHAIDARDWSTGSRRTAAVLAGVVLLGTTVVVLLAALW